MNKKGIVLIVSLMVITVILILTGIYLSGVISEKKFADSEKYTLQALNLAEAGANHALSELRKRVRLDLNLNVKSVSRSSVFNTYVTTNNPLGLLRDYAYVAGQGQFSVSNGVATFTVTPFNLNSLVQGSYAAVINITSAAPPTADVLHEVFKFYYNYNIESVGTITSTSPNIQKTVDLFQGNFTLTLRRDNFAKYALFTSHHRTPSGTTVWFTSNTNFNGPVATNEQFSFANNPSASFTEEVTQHLNKARFYNDGRPIQMDADRNGNKDVPVFDPVKGFQRGYDLINLESSITPNDMKNEALGTMNNPGQNGIYVPNNGTTLTGGIFIKGNSTVNMSVDGNNNPVYTVTQGATAKTITVNYANNTTTVVSGSTTNTYQGLPDGTSNQGTVIYSVDDITGFSGTVQSSTLATVASERDIVINNNVRYQQINAGPPLNAQGATNLLGILSWGGNVRIGTLAPNNVEIDGVIMAPHGIFTVDNYDRGGPRGTATLLGGAITDFYGPFGTFSGNNPVSGYGRNFVYDARMLQGASPPLFPYMSNFTSQDNNGLDQALVWHDKGA